MILPLIRRCPGAASIRGAFRAMAVLLAFGALVFAQAQVQAQVTPPAKPKQASKQAQGLKTPEAQEARAARENREDRENREADLPGDTEADPREPEKIKDDPHGRAEWFKEWFGPVAPGYLHHRQAVAEREIERWGAQIPGTAAHKSARSGRTAMPENTWRSIGPFYGVNDYSSPPHDKDIDTGRITVILPHPTNPHTLYVGFAGGGLWRCQNADASISGDWEWEPLTDGLPTGNAQGNVSIGSVAFKPDDPNTVYLSMGDTMWGSAMSGDAGGTAEGKGFFISSDGGETWTSGGTLGSSTRTKTVLALPGGIVLVAGNAGVWRSTNGGASFVQVTNENGLNAGSYDAWDIIRLDNGDLVVSFTGGTAYSTDNGANWTKGTHNSGFPGSVRRVAIAANGQTIYGLFASGSSFPKGLMKSTDRGRTWSYQAASTLYTHASGDGGQAGYNHMIAVDPDDPNTVFVGTNLCVYRSVNGGSTFEAMTHWYANRRHYMHADMHCAAWSQAGPKTLYIGTDGGLSVVRQPNISPIPSSSGIMPAADPSFIDNRRNKGVATHLIYNLSCTTAQTPVGSKHRVLIGLQDNGTRLRNENGLANGAYNEVLGGDGFGCLIHATNGNLMLGSIYNTDVYRSSNGGSSFSSSNSGITGAGSAGPFYTRLIDTPADPTGNRVYTFTNTILYASNNFGAPWTALPRTSNGWPGGTIRSFGASPLKLGLIGATFSNRVAISGDNGTTWTSFQGFPGHAGSTAEVAFDTMDENIMYVTSVSFSQTANHLWKSMDGGYTWASIDGTAEISNGFPFGIPVHCVKVDPTDNNVVYAGTDVGLYRSMNQGGTWERFGYDLPLMSVRDIYIAPDSSFMRLGTHGRGVWEMEGLVLGSMVVVPKTVSLHPSGTQTFTATITGETGAPAVTWTASGGIITQGGVYTAPATEGTYTVTATSQTDSTKSDTAIVTVANPITIAVAVLPKTATLPTGGTQAFTATVTGGSGNTAVVWTADGGDVTATGVYTAPAATGTYTVTATSQEDPSKEDTATVTVVNPIVVSITPRDTTLLTGATQAFTAEVTGGTGNTAVAWATSGGEITTGGIYTAPPSAGAYTVTAVSQEDTSKRDTVAVTVVPLGTVAIASHPGGLFARGTATFSAVAAGPGISDPSVTWDASSGAIDGHGNFTAPGMPQIITITATSVQDASISASVLVKVSSAAFDGNAKTNPQLLGLAGAFGSDVGSDPAHDAYDFDGSGRVDDDDLSMLFAEMGW